MGHSGVISHFYSFGINFTDKLKEASSCLCLRRGGRGLMQKAGPLSWSPPTKGFCPLGAQCVPTRPATRQLSWCPEMQHSTLAGPGLTCSWNGWGVQFLNWKGSPKTTAHGPFKMVTQTPGTAVCQGEPSTQRVVLGSV